MKIRIGKIGFMALLLFVLGGTALVFAQGGYGRGSGMMGYGHGYGGGPGWMMDRDGYGSHMRGWGWEGDRRLTREDAEKLEAARDQFYKDTQALREQINEKRLAMRAELAKQEPDSGNLTQLQQELSKLEGQFDQKALQHRLELRKLLPDAGYGPRYGMGYGRCWR